MSTSSRRTPYSLSEPRAPVLPYPVPVAVRVAVLESPAPFAPPPARLSPWAWVAAVVLGQPTAHRLVRAFFVGVIGLILVVLGAVRGCVGAGRAARQAESPTSASTRSAASTPRCCASSNRLSPLASECAT